jgi:hypothetical protein
MRLIFVLFALCPFKAISQIVVYNSSLLDTTQTLLYSDVPNRLVVKKHKATKNISVTSSNSKVNAEGDTLFIVEPRKPGFDTLRFYSNDALILEKAFRVDSLPQMKVCVGNFLGKYMSISQILSYPQLKLVFPITIYRHDISVFSFEMVATRKQEKLESVFGNQQQFSNKQLEIVKTLKAGDKLLFHNILAVRAGSKLRHIDDLEITIK